MTMRIVDIFPAHFPWGVAQPQTGSFTCFILGSRGCLGQCRQAEGLVAPPLHPRTVRLQARTDARALAAVVVGLSEKSWYQPFEGGLGLYRANAVHGSFVHVDVRGHPARWGAVRKCASGPAPVVL